MRALIIHAYSPANLGDGAITLATIAEIHRVFGPTAEVAVSATDPAAFKSMLGIPAHARPLRWRSLGNTLSRGRWLARNLPDIVLLWWGSSGRRERLIRVSKSRLLQQPARDAIAAYLRADLILAGGGGYLGDSYRRQLPFWHLEYRCATAAGLPLVFFSQSVGPARHPVTRYFLRKALERARLFIARDEPSRQNLMTLGTPGCEVVVCPDVALLFPGPERGAVVEATTRWIGVSLMRWANYADAAEERHGGYLDAVQAALEGLMRDHPDLHVRLFATNSAVGANPMDDEAVVADMSRRLRGHGFGDRCVVWEWTPRPDQFTNDVAQCELFIATRMHSAVLALNAGVPVVGIAYEEKMRGLLDMFGLDEFVVDINAPDTLRDVVPAAFDDRARLAGVIAERGPELRMQAARAMEHVARVIGDGGAAR